MQRKGFFDFALLDYIVAKNNPVEPFYFDSTICLLTQCIEKMLKGFLELETGESPIRTHKLTTLSRELSLIDGFEFLKIERGNLAILQDSYFDRRYPSEDYYVLDLEDFNNLTSSAYHIIDTLKSKLPNGIIFDLPDDSVRCSRMNLL